jgi:hypothetical protein
MGASAGIVMVARQERRVQSAGSHAKSAPPDNRRARFIDVFTGIQAEDLKDMFAPDDAATAIWARNR